MLLQDLPKYRYNESKFIHQILITRFLQTTCPRGCAHAIGL